MTYTPAPPRICSVCNQEFKRSGRGTKCSGCRGRQYRSTESYELLKEKNRIARKKYIIKKMYNITQEEFNEMLEAQDNKCAICFIHKDELARRMNIDHDHTCCPGKETCGNCVRGLICGSCNMALGAFKDNKVLLQRAIDYLDSYTGGGQFE